MTLRGVAGGEWDEWDICDVCDCKGNKGGGWPVAGGTDPFGVGLKGNFER
jgi:hypothetical protein